MQEKKWENRYRTTLVCIDSYEDRVPSGRLANPGLAEPVAFHGTVQFFMAMEQLLDDLRFPEPFAKLRSFDGESAVQNEQGTSFQTHTGQIASFQIRILFRQNCSWQGSVFWLEGKQEESFRSALELMLLMDSAMSKSA